MQLTDIIISPTDLDALTKQTKTVIIDTRDADSYQTGHIPNAVNLREIFTFLATSDEQGIRDMKDTFKQKLGEAGICGEEMVILYEDALNNGFGQSCRGYFLLHWLGYPNIKVLNGGYQGYVAAGLPVSTENTIPTSAQFPDNLTENDVMADYKQVLTAVKDDTVLLDVRDVVEWIGESSSPYGVDFAPRKGRIPTSRWIEWYRFMKPSAQGAVMKTPSEVKAECDSVGISKDDEIIIYCFKGARASNTFLALKQAGYEKLKIYFGSWNEWSRIDELPIENGVNSDTRLSA